MAQGNPTVLKIRTEIENLQGLNQLKTAVRRISAEAKSADNDFGRLTGQIKELQGATVKSINNLEAQKQAFQALRRSVDVTSKEFKNATEEIKKLDQQLAKAEGRKVGGGRLRAGAQIAGTIAGAGVFGGPEGAIGAAIGAIGGTPGAIVGGAIGAQVGQLRQALGGIAEYGAELSRLRIALRGVTASQEEYGQALAIVEQASQNFAIPQSVLTRQFTRLQASVQGAGGSVKDSETAFNGIVAAVRATGGSLADIDAALTATAQVFSKGKVSAEELRQQIGERLPGAFTLFAESIGLTPQELDKALEDGKVTLQDFLRFSESIFDRYGETAQIIADGPEGAGDRLKVALEKLNEDIAPELSNLGAQFQNFATEAIKALSSVFNALGNLGREIEKRLGGELLENQKNALAQAKRNLVRTDLTPLQRDFALRQVRTLQPIVEAAEFIGPPTPSPSALDKLREDEKDKTKTKTKKGKDPLAEARRQFASEFRGMERSFAEVARLELSRRTANLELQIIKAQRDQNKELEFSLKQKLELAKINVTIEGLNKQIEARQASIAKNEKKGFDMLRYEDALIKDRNSLLIAETEKNKILAEQEKERFLFNQKITEEINKQTKSFEQQFTDRQRELGLISESDYAQVLLRRERGRLAEEFPDIPEERRAQMLDLYRQEIDPTPFESMRQNISQLKDELRELVDPVNQITSAATTIGNAFAQSFTSVISGASTAKEALANFFQSVGSYFLDMAKQIIAKMIEIAILNSVAKLLPSTSLATSAGVSMSAGTATQSGFDMGSALAGMFKANGGPVNANEPYIVGERGPELFMPSSSGMVLSNRDTRDKLDQQNAAMRGNQATRQQLIKQQNTMTTNRIREVERTSQAMLASPDPIDVRYESSVINNVEYVTAEQHRKGMAQAAERGRALTLQALQNSVKTRSRVGI